MVELVLRRSNGKPICKQRNNEYFFTLSSCKNKGKLPFCTITISNNSKIKSCRYIHLTKNGKQRQLKNKK